MGFDEEKLMRTILGLILYLFPTGLLCSTLATEITKNGEVKWGLIPFTTSFYIILIYSLFFGLFIQFKRLIKEKVKLFLTDLINRIITIMLENPQIKLLFSDVRETKKMIEEINAPVLPKVLYGRTNNEDVILLLSPSSLFSHDTLVSLYTYQDGFEELIAIGRVLVIQDDKKIQIIIQNLISPNIHLIKDIGGNKKSVLENIIVKPNVPQTYFQYLSLGDEMK